MGDQQGSTRPADGLERRQNGLPEATRADTPPSFNVHVRAVHAGPGGSDFDVAFQAVGAVDSVEEGEARVARYLEEQATAGGSLVAQTEVFTALFTGLRETHAALVNGMRTMEDRRNVRIWRTQVLPLFKAHRADGMIGKMITRLAEIGHLRAETERSLVEWHQRKHLRAVFVYSLGAFVLGSVGIWAIWWSV